MQSGLTSFGLQETGKLILQNSAVEYNSMNSLKSTMADSPVLLRWKDHLHLSRMPMTKPSLHQQILPIESPSGSAFSFKSIIKLVPSNSTFVLVINWKKQRKYINWIRVRNYSNWKLKKGKKKYRSKCFSRKIIRTTTSYDRKAKYFVFLLDAW